MAEAAIRYVGQGFSVRGDKDRCVLPAAFRKVTKEASGGKGVLCLNKHEKWPCLEGFGLSFADQFEDQLDREDEKALKTGADFDRDVRSQQLYGFSEVPFDDSGRFVIPAHLRMVANITDQVFFAASGKKFFVWSPEELMRMGPGWESAQAACAAFIAERAGK